MNHIPENEGLTVELSPPPSYPPSSKLNIPQSFAQPYNPICLKE